MEMCRPRVGVANPLFSLWRALLHPMAPASQAKSCRMAEESRTKGLATIFFYPSTTLKNHKGGISNVKFIFIQHFLAHLAFRPGELLSSLFVRRPSVNISHFNLLLRNHWANCNQTLVEWSLDGPLPKMCLVIPTSNQDGHQAKNRKKGG